MIYCSKSIQTRKSYEPQVFHSNGKRVMLGKCYHGFTLERQGRLHVHVCLHVERRKGEIPVQAMKHRSKSVFSDSTAKKRVFLGRTTN